MTLYEFNIMSFDDKYETATEGSLFLYNYITKAEVYECYSFAAFFVEIVYDNEDSIIEIRSFKTGEELYKFSGKIELH